MTVEVIGERALPDENEPPEGWALAKITDVCRLNPRKLAKDALPGDAHVTFIPMPAVDAEAGAITEPQSREFSAIRNGYTSFRDGDVIMAKITPCMENGKTAIARGLENGVGFGSTEFHVLRPSEAILAEYVHYFIRQESFRRTAESEMTGTVGQKRVPAAFLESVTLPLPPLAEQRRIVAKVEDLLKRVNAARARLDRAPELLRRLRQSVLSAACSGRLTADWRGGGAEDGWKTVKSDSLLEFVTSGSRGWARYYTDSGPSFLRVGNLDHDSIQLDLSRVQRVSPPKGAETARTAVQPGDILISVTADVGMIGLAPPSLGEAYVNQHVVIARPRAGVSPAYLAWFFASASGQAQFEELQRGATKKGLGLDDIRAVDVALPPLAEQHEIVRRVEALFAFADAIERRVAAAKARADRLRQSVLAKAFRGELVPTEAELARREGRSYEAAAALLERGRAGAVVAGRGRRGAA
jgi:type I restriction enzyme S subunit